MQIANIIARAVTTVRVNSESSGGNGFGGVFGGVSAIIIIDVMFKALPARYMTGMTGMTAQKASWPARYGS